MPHLPWLRGPYSLGKKLSEERVLNVRLYKEKLKQDAKFKENERKRLQG